MSKPEDFVQKDAGSGKTMSFGLSLKAMIQKKGESQAGLSNSLGVTTAYVSALTTGKKGASAETVTRVSNALGLSAAEEVALHRAAAIDAGFKLDLPSDF